MNKLSRTVITSIVLAFVIALFGTGYSRFVRDMIFSESVMHLEEIFHQSNSSLNKVLNVIWTNTHLWADYLDGVSDEATIRRHMELAREESGFTDFYFISRSGNYHSLSGEEGYMDFGGELSELIVRNKDVAVNSIIPGKPQIMLFAAPSKKGVYDGFEYEAIGVGYNNSDIIETLNISAFNGEASSFVISSKGRVIIDNAKHEHDNFYNFTSSVVMESTSNENSEKSSIADDIAKGRKGAALITFDGVENYMIYESCGIGDWVLVGLVPSAVVNSSMNKLQYVTIAIVIFISIAVAAAILMFIVMRNRMKIREKDASIAYRDEMFEKLSNSIDDVFIMLDAQNLKVDYISPNIERLTGIREASAYERIHEIESLIKDSETELILEHLSEIEAGSFKVWDREYVHIETGETRFFRVVVFCTEIYGDRKYIIDMSDRTNDKRIRDELETAVMAAENANKAKSTFLSNMSHDIRTPMNAIMGFTTLAQSNIDNKDKLKDYLSKISYSGNHLLSLINDILDMSRIESGNLSLEETEANLSSILHELRTIVCGQIHAKQLELYMDTMDVTDEDVYCDKIRMNQLLLNLLSNAIKFTPPGGTVSVRIRQLKSAAPGKGSYELSVKDTGIGMSEEFAKKIFTPFERERTSTVSRIQGTGLGTAIAKNIVDMMGGTIEVITEQGKGTEFIVRFELRLRGEEPESYEVAELEGMSVLVVDDDFNTCDSVTKMLVRMGMRSDWTVSGKEAVLRAKHAYELNDSFGAYIIDWRLPDVNGIEVTRRIRELGDDRPIIILSAYDWTDIESEALAAGVTGFCAKPMFMSDLRDVLLESLGRKTEHSDSDTGLSGADELATCRGKRLLLAEDNELNREIAYEILTEYGFIVDTCQNGLEACEILAETESEFYSMILMDIQMPIMDGYEATRRIRAMDDQVKSSIPIVAMTANAFEEDRNEAFKCGMNAFVSKPLVISEIVNVLKEIIG